jgi:hypothetical protein
LFAKAETTTRNTTQYTAKQSYNNNTNFRGKIFSITQPICSYSFDLAGEDLSDWLGTKSKLVVGLIHNLGKRHDGIVTEFK